jgi:uncharacterized membrane protein
MYKRGVSESIERLSFELSTAALAEQERALATFRTGAGTVLGAASVAASLLSARDAGHRLDPWMGVALVAYALCAAVAIWVLLPRDLAFSFRGNELIVTSEALDVDDVVDGYRVACGWIEPHLEMNRSTLAGISQRLTWACMLLAIEVVMLTISITV